MNAILMFFVLLGLINANHLDDGVEITEEDEEDREDAYLEKTENLRRLKRATDNLLKSYIDNLKNGQEIVLSSDTGFAGNKRFKSGDVHIKKESSSQKPPEITEKKKPRYFYPFGIGTYLMNGCYQYIGMSDYITSKQNADTDQTGQAGSGSANNNNNQAQDYDAPLRKKRASFQNQTNDMRTFCSRYAALEQSVDCKKMISGAYTLGTGFDVKYENSENSRRKSVITRYCNYRKMFNDKSVPDIMTANGIYDTKTQTQSFGESNDYMKFIASKSNLDRYSNVFSGDTKNAYGGVSDQAGLAGRSGVAPGDEKSDENIQKDTNSNLNAKKTTSNSDFWLFQIQSTILMYDLILDQISPWTLDPELIIDFLFLPESYFHSGAPKLFERFISRYGTHVVVSAKFGGEFKIIHTMRKTKTSSIEKFSEQCTEDSMKLFSRSWSANANAILVKSNNKNSEAKNETNHHDSSRKKVNTEYKRSEYSSTYLSVKGGSQEVAAIVANLNQPDFAETFIGWLKSVSKYPRGFDLKYESIVSILNINPRVLFATTAEKERRICEDYTKANCKFGFTLDEFEQKWQRILKALQFAITIYLKEPNGLTMNKFFIRKGDSDCRFNILNYLSPYWSEITSGSQEFHITFSFNSDEEADPRKSVQINEFLFKRTDEVYFTRRDDFWLAKRKGDIYTYQSAKLLNEPFKATNQSKYMNILGLVLEYSEKDATVTVVNMSKLIQVYANQTGCAFEVKNFKFNSTNSTNASSSSGAEPFISYRARSSVSHSLKRQNKNRKCKTIYKTLLMNMRNVKNLSPFWIELWQKVIGVVDYVDPIKAVLRTWDSKYAVLPCQLKWSNNLMMVLAKEEKDGKCLRFTAATEGELFVVIASTPSNQNTWYTFQVTTKGVIFYKGGSALLLNEDSAAGTTGDKNIYQNFFICLNYEKRKMNGSNSTHGLYIQYGIQIDSDETSHLYLSYFDTEPLDPMYYSFGSRNADVQVLNAHLENFNIDEQIRLRCKLSSTLNKAILTTCDYQCNFACDGCFVPYSVMGCKRCAYAKLIINASLSGYKNSSRNFLCLEKCPTGFEPDLLREKLCTDIDECSSNEKNECQTNAVCINTIGSYKCICKDGFQGNGLFCEDINECEIRSDNCSSKAECINLDGTFKCKCLEGFTGDGYTCTDIDECQLLTDNCEWNRFCQNTIGSFKCICPDGFKMINNECIEINECSVHNKTCADKNAHCQNTFGSYECVCRQGFTMYNDYCHDINECHTKANNCDLTTQICINTLGSFICECKDGLTGLFYNGLIYCSNENKCDMNSNKCSENSVCVQNQKYETNCECKEGYYKSQNEKCLDVNECHLKLHDCDSESSCVNTDGSFYCKCDDGFEIDELKKCHDINECQLETYDCEPDMICLNTYGSYYCQCSTEIGSGNEVDTFRICPDNEGINMSCEMSNGILVCNCDKGFIFRTEFNSSGYQICDDIDECKTNEFICGPNAICHNEYGSYSCECLKGFIPKYAHGFECEDFDECSSECSHNCDPVRSYCVNRVGTYECVCLNGFFKDDSTNECLDVDECSYPKNQNVLKRMDNCNENAQCVNSYGSFRCVCKAGFYGNGTYCEDINECIDLEPICSLAPNSYCVNLIGSYECRCMDGFRRRLLDGECIDIDECAEDLFICHDRSVCANLIGSYSCICDAGYTWSKKKQKCEDINECVYNSNTNDVYATHVCDDNSICVNTIGSFECLCKSGWNKTDLSYCSDINECKLEKNGCNVNSICHNKPGSYECVCLDGFDGDGFTCNDIDECLEENACLDVYHKCVNTIGSFKCVCIDGFVTDLNGICIDLNECEQYHPCNQNSICVNMLGSYRCECLNGFEKLEDNSNECLDINECSESSKINECHEYAICTNTYGSYNCSCIDGFVGDGKLCTDIDECYEYINSNETLCNNTGYCVNTIGYFRCVCLEGFSAKNNSNVCTDIDECLYESCFSQQNISEKLCYSFGLCRNTYGSYVCECFDGFKYDITKGHCTDIDECNFFEKSLRITNICQKDAYHMQSCTNTCGNFTCECKDTSSTVLDIYDTTKCYSRNQIRDFIFYMYLKKTSVEVFAKSMKVLVESCANISLTKEFNIKLNSFHETLMQIKDQYWFPVYIDNTEWNSIEFICQVQLKILILADNHYKLKDFKYIMIEDPTRNRCSFYETDSIDENKSDELFILFTYQIDSIWELPDSSEHTCETSFDLMRIESTETNNFKFLVKNKHKTRNDYFF